MTTLHERFVNVLYALDETCNAAFGGKPIETISGTVGRAAEKGDVWAVRLAEPFVDWLMREPGHCRKAAAAEARRRAASDGAFGTREEAEQAAAMAAGAEGGVVCSCVCGRPDLVEMDDEELAATMKACKQCVVKVIPPGGRA